MVLFSEWNEPTLRENLLCFRTGDPMLLKALGDIAFVPLEGKVMQCKQPVPEPLSKLELCHRNSVSHYMRKGELGGRGAGGQEATGSKGGRRKVSSNCSAVGAGLGVAKR
jgi:hypothetical protein